MSLTNPPSGSLTSVRSGLSLVGTALMGRLSDSNTSILARSIGSVGKDTRPSGRRACLYIGTVATIFGLVIAISVDSLQGLWLSMIPSALVGVARSMTDHTSTFFIVSHHPNNSTASA